MPEVAEFMGWVRAAFPEEDGAMVTAWVRGRRGGWVCATENGATWCTRVNCPVHGGGA